MSQGYNSGASRFLINHNLKNRYSMLPPSDARMIVHECKDNDNF